MSTTPKYATPSEFARIISAALDRGTSAQQLADEFEVSVTAIFRWASGVTRPRDRTAYEVVRALEGEGAAEAWKVHES